MKIPFLLWDANGSYFPIARFTPLTHHLSQPLSVRERDRESCSSSSSLPSPSPSAPFVPVNCYSFTDSSSLSLSLSFFPTRPRRSPLPIPLTVPIALLRSPRFFSSVLLAAVTLLLCPPTVSPLLSLLSSLPETSPALACLRLASSPSFGRGRKVTAPLVCWTVGSWSDSC